MAQLLERYMMMMMMMMMTMMMMMMMTTTMMMIVMCTIVWDLVHWSRKKCLRNVGVRITFETFAWFTEKEIRNNMM